MVAAVADLGAAHAQATIVNDLIDNALRAKVRLVRSGITTEAWVLQGIDGFVRELERVVLDYRELMISETDQG